ncbi:hypothetical protein Droror1_Dr00020204 [Drosera rotundifolia]
MMMVKSIHNILSHHEHEAQYGKATSERSRQSRKEEEGDKGIERRRESSLCETVVAPHVGGMEDGWRRRRGRESWAVREAAATAAVAKRSAAEEIGSATSPNPLALFSQRATSAPTHEIETHSLSPSQNTTATASPSHAAASPSHIAANGVDPPVSFLTTLFFTEEQNKERNWRLL